MPIAPWQETAYKVVIEFKKGNKGVSRVINLTHRPDVLPQQLYGRVAPDNWRRFMDEVDALSKYHPYVVRQDIGQCCFNLQGLACWLCIGFGFFNPDGGNYSVWTREVNDALAHWQPTFSAGGCRLSLHAVHGSNFIQIDIDPNVAVGLAVPPPMPPQYDTTKPAYGAPPPGYGAPPPQAYPPQQGAPPPGTYPTDPAAASWAQPQQPQPQQPPVGYPPEPVKYPAAAPAMPEDPQGGYNPGPAMGWQPPAAPAPGGGYPAPPPGYPKQ